MCVENLVLQPTYNYVEDPFYENNFLNLKKNQLRMTFSQNEKKSTDVNEKPTIVC